jgi:hypothetical protein
MLNKFDKRAEYVSILAADPYARHMLEEVESLLEGKDTTAILEPIVSEAPWDTARVNQTGSQTRQDYHERVLAAVEFRDGPLRLFQMTYLTGDPKLARELMAALKEADAPN